MEAWQIAQLAELERDMDSGKVPFVVNNGQRWAFPKQVFEDLELVTGQTVSGGLLLEILKYNLSYIQTQISIADCMKE